MAIKIFVKDSFLQDSFLGDTVLWGVLGGDAVFGDGELHRWFGREAVSLVGKSAIVDWGMGSSIVGRGWEGGIVGKGCFCGGWSFGGWRDRWEGMERDRFLVRNVFVEETPSLAGTRYNDG